MLDTMADRHSSMAAISGVRLRILGSVALAVLLSFGTLGCGQQKIDRKPIFGRVVGAEGRDGIVTFIPIDSTIGPAVTRSFKNGAYAFGKNDGPVPGEYNVQVKLVVDETATQNQPPSRRDKRASAGGRVAYEPETRTTVSVPAEEPFELDLHPPDSKPDR